MKPDTTRRQFLLTGAASLAAGSTGAVEPERLTQPPREVAGHAHHDQSGAGDYPRDRPGAGGPDGSPTYKGKLVPGFREAGDSPVPIQTPDLLKLNFEMKAGVKEFHLHARHTRREFLPGMWFDVWGYNELMPGPTIEVTEGDRVRIVLHNDLPESTVLHLHGIELPNRFDGVPGVTQDPIRPGETFAYEFTAHQVGTFFYHSHGSMQEGLGMAGMLFIHPRSAFQPVVDHDFGLLIQEWAILPQATVPNVTSMEFNFFTINGRSAPYTTPLLVRLGSRVRIRMVNMSPIDHHPMHLHGHTFWVTGTEGGRIPETAWWPANNVLVGVAQAREIEFIANNPGDWVLHCHMFHHMMNHMTVMVGPMGGHTRRGMPAGANAQSGMGMTQGGPALSADNGPSLGRGLGEQQSSDRAVRTGPGAAGSPGAPGEHAGHGAPNSKRVPGFPADMMDMMGMQSEADLKKINKPETRGMRRNWFAGVEALHTIVRVLPAELYDRVVSGKGEIEPGSSVPGGGPGEMPGMNHAGHGGAKGTDGKSGGHEGHDMPKSKDGGHEGHGIPSPPKDGKKGGEHDHKH